MKLSLAAIIVWTVLIMFFAIYGLGALAMFIIDKITKWFENQNITEESEGETEVDEYD